MVMGVRVWKELHAPPFKSEMELPRQLISNFPFTGSKPRAPRRVRAASLRGRGNGVRVPGSKTSAASRNSLVSLKENNPGSVCAGGDDVQKSSGEERPAMSS